MDPEEEVQGDQSGVRRAARWYVSTPDPRRASFRYRCLYPMAELQRVGALVGFFDENEAAEGLVVAFDGWSMFPTVAPEASAEAALAAAVKLKRKGARVVVDNCDNQFSFARPDQAWGRALARLRDICTLADRVVVCSESLGDAMRAEIGEELPLMVIDDPVEDQIVYPGDSFINSLLSPARKRSWLVYARHRLAIHRDRCVGRTPLVWFGSHGNQFASGGMLDLLPLRQMMEEVDRSNPISLTLISNNSSKFMQNFRGWNFPVRYLEWDRVNFLALLRLHDISIIPVEMNSFTRCKSSNRVTLSLHHGLAVIADPVPSYSPYASVIRMGDWAHNLKDYISRPHARHFDIAAGQVLVQERNGIQIIARKWKLALCLDDALP